jgi:hypothetical protein
LILSCAVDFSFHFWLDLRIGFFVSRADTLVDFFGHLASAPPGLSSSFFLAACGLSSDCSVRFFFSVLGEQVLGSVSLVDFQVPQSH